MKISKAYGGVTLGCAVITGTCQMMQNLERMQRQFTYENDYMEFKFNDMHQKEIGDDTAQFGYPDDGNGRYTQGRQYADWYYMNVTKRVIQNDLEHITTIIPLSLVTGLFNPYPTIGLLSTYFLGRVLYTKGYFMPEGALNKQRMVGSVLCNLSHVGVLGLTIYTAVMLRRGRLAKFIIPK
ncbi:UNKNOWN [Stylonychia lemnae]|uniref:Mapeg family protein n=1 Tax=Stylonychia lemnae TaxID=5949 RepID=A0A078B2X9_STYLE|nr:UNKNOWN [Stylonychia lemnae]|eukprot:CDW87863.1 UNKNOWN [Stylonychia lemnae]